MDSKLRVKILNEIKSSPKEIILRKNIVDKFVKNLESSIKKVGYNCSIFIGGSYGKDTYLKDSSDVDIFVRFDKSYEDKDISLYLKDILDDVGIKYIKQKGSRDYYSCYIKEEKLEIKFELVPNRFVLDANDMVNSTDVSPLHVDFLKKKFSKNKNLSDEIRLAKQFFKSKNLYGAESYINGFSGHIIDILIAYYGSLDKLLLGAKSWGEDMFIDINNFYKDFKEAKKEIESDKLSKLVIVDPIIKNRNAAKALSDENYYKFLIIAQNFTNFSEYDFKVEKFDLVKTISSAKKFAKNSNVKAFFYIFDLELGERSEDIVGSKLLKLNNKLKKLFESYDFEVFKNDYFIDISKNQALFVFFFEKYSLASLRKIKGPYAYMSVAVKNFLADKSIYFIEENRVYAYEQRVFTRVEQVSKLDKKGCLELVGREVGFIKKIKIMKV